MKGLRVLPWVGGIVTLAGLAAAGVGLYLFGSAFLTPSSTFFADPHGTMDTVKRDSFIGILCVGLSGVLVPGGALLLALGLVVRSLQPRAAAARR